MGADIAGPGSTDGANLIIGSTTGNIKMFIGAPEDANVITQISSTGLMPGANLTYDLGSSTAMWKDLWLSGGIAAPLSVSPAPYISGFTISSPSITATGNISGNVNGYSIGYRDIPQVTFTSNATLALSDAGKHYYSTNSANIITIPNNSTVSFTVGTAISIIQQGTANLTVTPGSGVTMYLAGNSTSASRTVGNYGMATLIKVATDTWFISGAGVA